MSSKVKAVDECETWYEKSYSELCFGAQRMYPNEELCRFMGRNFFALSFDERRKVTVVEMGCGSGANLWMIAKENFDAYGCDLSSEGIKLCEKMLERYNVTAELSVYNMMETGYSDDFFDVVLDIVSSPCLCEKDYSIFLKETKRILKPGGHFYSYVFAQSSDAFINHEPAKLIDKSTLNGIYRKDSPFYGNFYPFRFVDKHDVPKLFKEHGFEVVYCEEVRKTYRGMRENLDYLSIEAKKK